jgi:hypothetical protein
MSYSLDVNVLLYASDRTSDRRMDLVPYAVPNASFDAVLQRRQHAVRPDGGFADADLRLDRPQPVGDFCNAKRWRYALGGETFLRDVRNSW